MAAIRAKLFERYPALAAYSAIESRFMDMFVDIGQTNSLKLVQNLTTVSS